MPCPCHPLPNNDWPLQRGGEQNTLLRLKSCERVCGMPGCPYRQPFASAYALAGHVEIYHLEALRDDWCTDFDTVWTEVEKEPLPNGTPRIGVVRLDSYVYPAHIPGPKAHPTVYHFLQAGHPFAHIPWASSNYLNMLNAKPPQKIYKYPRRPRPSAPSPDGPILLVPRTSPVAGALPAVADEDLLAADLLLAIGAVAGAEGGKTAPPRIRVVGVAGTSAEEEYEMLEERQQEAVDALLALAG